MAERTYYAKRIVQWKGAPALYVISVTPEDLLSWADVPRKAPRAMAGYQRPLDEDRADRIAEFMEHHVNHIVPGTVIVSSEKKEGAYFTIEDLEITGVDASEHNLFKIKFNYPYDMDPEDITSDMIKEMLDEIIADYEGRLSDDERDMLSTTNTVISTSGEEDVDAAQIEEDNLVKPSGYTQFVKQLHELCDSGILPLLDQEWQEEVLPLDEGELDGLSEADRAQKEADHLKEIEDVNAHNYWKSEAEDWKTWIISEHKIGNIMDGQHRVWGAKEMNPDVADHLDTGEQPNISVTLIPDLMKAEQVFHFSMMNMTPVKVKAGLARSSAIHSLTVKELDEYDERLGNFIDVTQARWINEIYRDGDSPFEGMLTWDFLDNPNEQYVDEKIMVQIAKKWYNSNSKTKMFGGVFQGGTSWNVDEDTMNFRLQAFFVFWDEVRKKFPKDWDDKNSNIWRKVSLIVLQDWIRVQMSVQLSLWVKSSLPPFNDLDALRDFVNHVLSSFPGDFFQHPWTVVDDTPKGRDDFFLELERQNGNEKANKRTWLFKGAGS